MRVRTSGGKPGPTAAFEQVEDPFDDLCWPEAQPSVWERVGPQIACDPNAHQGTLQDLELAVPVVPGKLVCVGRNYRAHAAELGNEVPSEPLLFLKPTSALVPSGGEVVVPPGFARIDMESELVAVIGQRAHHVTTADALDYVAGYTLGNDVSNRDLQRGDKQWTRGKGFDTFAPLGPWVRLLEPGTTLPADARIQGYLEGELRQDAPLSAMVFDVATVVAYISACMTLHPGDVIYTGTPAGVAQLSPGQSISIKLSGFELGQLDNVLVSG